MDLSPDTMVSQKYVQDLSLYYSQVTSHVITGDGKFLLAAIKAGHLAVFPIRRYLKDISNSDITNGGESVLANRMKKLKPLSLIPLKNAHSLQLDPANQPNQYRFVAGGHGTLQGHVLSQSDQLENTWTIRLSSESTLANVITLTNDKIFSGCSDNHVYVHDKETQQELARLTGHQDYILSLKTTEDHIPMLYSASEDGSVRSWDLRTHKDSTSVILPFKKGSLERPQFGKWIGALDVRSGEFMVCGGGPKLSLWHLRSSKCVDIIDSDNVTHVAQFLPSDPSSIMFAGNGNQVETWRKSQSGPVIDRIYSSIDNIYSIAHHHYADFDYKLFSFAGDSFKLELCKNGKFIDSELFVS